MVKKILCLENIIVDYGLQVLSLSWHTSEQMVPMFCSAYLLQQWTSLNLEKCEFWTQAKCSKVGGSHVSLCIMC